MRSFADKKNRSGSTGLPAPRVCQVSGCGQPAAVVFAVVRSESGEFRSGAAADFGESTPQGWMPHPHYTLLHWVGRCARHYSADVLRRRGQHRAAERLDGPAGMLTREQHREYLEVMKNYLRRGSGGVRRTLANQANGRWSEVDEQRFRRLAEDLGIVLKPAASVKPKPQREYPREPERPDRDFSQASRQQGERR